MEKIANSTYAQRNSKGGLHLTETLKGNGVTITLETTRSVLWSNEDRERAYARHNEIVQKVAALLDEAERELAQ